MAESKAIQETNTLTVGKLVRKSQKKTCQAKGDKSPMMEEHSDPIQAILQSYLVRCFLEPLNAFRLRRCERGFKLLLNTRMSQEVRING